MADSIFTITKGAHKRFLLEFLFFVEEKNFQGLPQKVERKFSITKRDAAKAVRKKLISSYSDLKDKDGNVIGGQFTDGDLEFNFDEAAFIKTDLDEKMKGDLTCIEDDAITEILPILN